MLSGRCRREDAIGGILPISVTTVTTAEDRKRFHLADEFFAPTETKAFLNGERACLLHNLVKASILDEASSKMTLPDPRDYQATE